MTRHDFSVIAEQPDTEPQLLTRRHLLGIFAATTLVAAPTFSNASGLLRGAGDIRRLKMTNGRSGEMIDMVYWADGQYIPEALNEINFFMRDLRANKIKNIDTRTLDILAAAHNLMDVSAPYTLLSGYRTAKTNAQLRRNSRGVAKKSLHMEGKAADVRLPGRSVTAIARAAAACNSGGVGKYRRSKFVHMDCGPVRSWNG